MTDLAASARTPALSVLIPTHGRPDLLRTLLGHLERQTLEPERFEVVVVDDGSPQPLAVDVAALPFAALLLRQEQAGPGAARNRGLERCRAPLVLILNDDAVPAPDLLERHLIAQSEVPERCAVLGSFRFTEAARRSPFVQVLDATNRLFAFRDLVHGRTLGWSFFWTCNISLPVEAIRSAGGFDADRFPEALCEDVELGYRLHQQGWRVVYREDCRAEHDHVLTVESYLRRAQRLGVYIARMWTKHGDPSVVWQRSAEEAQFMLMQSVSRVEFMHSSVPMFQETVERLEAMYTGKPVPRATIDRLDELIGAVALVPVHRGIHQELTGIDPLAVIESGAPPGTGVSVVIVSRDARPETTRCIESLRRAREHAHPLQIVVVDCGSTDGSAEWLRAQSDVHLIDDPGDPGLLRARNRAIPFCTGQWIAFAASDTCFASGWMSRALYHGAVDPQIASIALVSNGGSGLGEVEYGEGPDPSGIETCAERLWEELGRRGTDANLSSTSPVTLVKRAVLERLGGFDERFSPRGFAEEDLALRIAFAGSRNRVALDCFVYCESAAAEHLEPRPDWLLRGWQRFVAKWSQPGLQPEPFDFEGLGLREIGEVGEDRLFAGARRESARAPGAGRGAAAAPAPGDGAECSLTVLVCSYERLDPLRECLASFEAQTARGRYEIVVVNDGSTDGTREWLDAWTPSVPARIVHRENGGLAAARNSGLEVARGERVLLVNDDTIADPGLVEAHLRAHEARAGRSVAILGTFEQPADALENALMRVLEDDILVFCYPGLEPDTEYDWTRFWTCNISVPLADVRAVGDFDPSFRHYGCEDTDLAYRLHTDRGIRVFYEPRARANHLHVLDFDALARRNRTVARAWIRLFCKHPDCLEHPDWSWRAERDRVMHERALAGAAPERARHEALARELSRIDLGVLERSGRRGGALAASICELLRSELHGLNRLWWHEGELEGLREHGLDSLAALRGGAGPARSRGATWVRAAAPWPLATRATQRYLAWPRYDRDDDLVALLEDWGELFVDRPGHCLCLRHDPSSDGPLDVAVQRIESVFRRRLGPEPAVELLLVDGAIPDEDLPRLGAAVTAVLDLGTGARKGFAEQVGVRVLRVAPEPVRGPGRGSVRRQACGRASEL